MKPNVTLARKAFIVKCNVAASMKRSLCEIYVQLCQKFGEVFYAKCSCKADAGGSCKHVAVVLSKLVDYKERSVNSVPGDCTCTDLLQQ